MYRVSYTIFGSLKTREFATKSEAEVFASKMRNAMAESDMLPKLASQAVRVDEVKT